MPPVWTSPLLGLAFLLPTISRGTILIDDGNDFIVSSPVVAAEDYDTDHQNTPGGGSLTINSSGSLIFNQPLSVKNTFGSGSLTIDGILEHNANAFSGLFTPLTVNQGGIVRSLNSSLNLSADSNFASGSRIEANGGDITLLAGTHNLSGPNLSGNSDLVLQGGTLIVLRSIGTETGAATGGLSLLGGTAQDFFSIVSGGDTGHLSVARGTLGSATIGTPGSNNLALRFTSTGAQLPETTLSFHGGRLVNEGIFTHHDGGTIQLDATTGPGAGAITNTGTWNLLGSATFLNNFGSGTLTNRGLLQTTQSGDKASITANFTNTQGSRIHTHPGSSISFQGSSTFQSNSILDLDGDLVLDLGSHEMAAANLTGSGYLQVGDPASFGSLFGGAGSLRVQSPIGPITGPATGGLHLNSGIILPGNLGLGGPEFSLLSAERGLLSSGTIAGPTLRFTGNSLKTPGTTVSISSGHLINEGIFTQEDGGLFELDPPADDNLNGSITNAGTWDILGEAEIKSTRFEGRFTNSGTLQTKTSSDSPLISSRFTSTTGSTIRTVPGSSLTLTNRADFQENALLKNEGNLILGPGEHFLRGASLTGEGFLQVGDSANFPGLFGLASVLNIDGPSGPVTGEATGGLLIDGGRLQPAPDSPFGGFGLQIISADHGQISGGFLDDATLRFTGPVVKNSTGKFNLSRSTLISEGLFDHRSEGRIDLDPSAEILTGGTLTNRGIWNLGNLASIESSHGEGLFKNEGELNLLSGLSTVTSALINLDGGTIQVSQNGFLTLAGSSRHEAGSHLHLDGALSLPDRTHVLHGTEITGSGALNFTGGSLHLNSRVGPATGPATGGLNFDGGTLRDKWISFGGGTTPSDETHGQINLDHGILRSGTINGAEIRYTGTTLQPGAATFEIARGTLINDGTHTQANGGHFELDPDSDPSTLGQIINNGTWLSTGTSNISNRVGGAIFENNGLLDQGPGTLTITTLFDNNGGTVHARQGIINLTGGSDFGIGSNLFADGEAIFLRNGTHRFTGGVLTGNQYTYFTSGTTNILGPVGSESGPATGRFGINGGTVTGTQTLSAATGWLHSGLVTGDVTLRLTGDSLKPTNSSLNLNGGTIRNEGSLVHQSNGSFNLDSLSSNGFGTIENFGTWQITGNTSFQNTYGDGLISNHGAFLQETGTTTINATLHNKATGLISSTGGSTRLNGGGFHQTGSILRADGGSISLGGGTHLFTGGSFEGPGFVYTSGGTVRLDGNVGPTTGPATGGFGITGGTVTGTGTISVDRAFFSSGSITGDVILRVTGDLSQQDATSISMNGGTLQNESPTTQTIQGNFNLDSTFGGGAGNLINSGIWELVDDTTYSNTYGEGSFTNRGTFLSSAGRSTILAPFFHDPGSTLRVTDGWLRLSGGGTMEPGATIDSTAGDLYFSGGTHLLEGGSLTGTGFTYLTGGTATVAGDLGATTGPATGGFGIAGGTLNGTHTLSVDHAYFSTGTITGSPTLRLTGSSSKITSTTLNMNGGTLLNQGTFTGENSANFNLDSTFGGGAGTLLNQGTWILDGDATYFNTYGGGQVINEGHFIHDDPDISTISAAFHHRDGSLLESRERYLRLSGGGSMEPGTTLFNNGGDTYFSGGTHTLNGGTITGEGFTFLTGGTATVAGDLGATTGPATGGFGIAGGTLNGTHTLSADHGYLSTGTITGSPTLRLTGNSSKVSSTTLNMDGGTLINQGTLTGETSANFNLDSNSSAGAGTLVNQGTWLLDGNATYFNTYGNGQVINEGHFIQDDPDISTISAAFHHRDGSLLESRQRYLSLSGGGSMEPGTTLFNNGGNLYFSGGTHTLHGGTILGPGFTFLTGGTATVAGDLGATTGPATGGFSIAGGTLNGTRTLSVDHGSFSTGTITGSPTLRLTGNSTKLTSTTLNMNGGTLLNQGTFTGENSANFNLDSTFGGRAGTLLNQGTWILDGNATYFNTYGGGQVINEGHFIHDDPDISTISAAFHHRDGSLLESRQRYLSLSGGGSMEPGTTLFNNGGNLYFSGGTHTLHGGTILGPGFTFLTGGTATVAGDLGANTGPATGGFSVAGGTLNGTHTLSVDHAYFSTGTITGSPTLRLTGSSTKLTSTTLNMNGGTILNQGTFTGETSANFNLDSTFGGGAGTLLNQGTWVLDGDATFFNTYGGGFFDNEGILEILSGRTSLNAAISNSGAISVTNGSLALNQSSNHSGSLIANGSVSFNAGSHRFTGPGALLGGTSWIYGSVSLADSAVLSPGNSTGNLHLAGSLSFTTVSSPSIMMMEINSPADHDQISLENTSSLNLGSASAILLLKLHYAPTPNDTIRLVSAENTTGRFSGSFDNAPNTGSNITAVFQGTIYEFEITYDPAGKFIDLTAITSTSPFDTWANQEGLTGDDALYLADPDGDGHTNGFEFLYGLNPNTADRHTGSLFSLTPETITFIFRQNQAASYLNPTAQSTADLSNWQPLINEARGVSITSTENGFAPGIDQVTVTLPRSRANHLFLRLRLP